MDRPGLAGEAEPPARIFMRGPAGTPSAEYAPGEVFSVSVRGCGARRETGGRVPDQKLCYAVLTTMIPNVEIDCDSRGICCIRMHS